MSKHIRYVTREGQRWDSIAWECYGDPAKMTVIVRANPAVPLYDTLPGGLQLKVPVLEPPTSPLPDPERLPPWKR